jgi:hypothetical protein
MSTKPHKPRRRGPTIREQIRAELANIVLNGGDLDHPEAEAVLSAQRGRPVMYDWFRIAVEMCWHLSGKGPWGKLKRDEFIAKMQTWCQQELDVKPSADELKRRIGVVRKRFPRG